VRAHRLSPEAVRAYRHVPMTDRVRVRVVVVPWLVPGVAAMTVGRLVLVRRGHEHDELLLAHELVHVQQWREHRAAFLARYLGEYVRHRAAGMPHQQAYAAISFERDARARARSASR